MIDVREIGEIIQVYARHGWILRRVLLSDALKKRLNGPLDALFGDAPVIDSDIDAAWFSRPPRVGGVSWELRHLNDHPYALLEKMDEFEAEFEDRLREVESRLRDAVAV